MRQTLTDNTDAIGAVPALIADTSDVLPPPLRHSVIHLPPVHVHGTGLPPSGRQRATRCCRECSYPYWMPWHTGRENTCGLLQLNGLAAGSTYEEIMTTYFVLYQQSSHWRQLTRHKRKVCAAGLHRHSLLDQFRANFDGRTLAAARKPK
jgi:hypothetical protein